MEFKDIKELIRVFDKSELNKLSIKEGDFQISMQRGFENKVTALTTSIPTQTAVSVPTNTPLAIAQNETIEVSTTSASLSGGLTINAPMVGTFYSSPSPDSPSFVGIGDVVRKGQVLCILEAMKIMNEVEAEFDCKIVDILVQNGDPVEFDMPIFVVEKI